MENKPHSDTKKESLQEKETADTLEELLVERRALSVKETPSVDDILRKDELDVHIATLEMSEDNTHEIAEESLENPQN